MGVIEFIVEHIQAVLAAHEQGGTSKAAWVIITGAMPEIEKIMSFPTWRQYCGLVVALNKSGNLSIVKHGMLNTEEELKNVKQLLLNSDEELKNVKQMLLNKNEEIEAVKQGLLNSNVKQSKVKQSKPKQGLCISGWSIQQSGGFYRAFKRVSGKIEGVYIGKNLDDAIEKIEAKEEQLRLLTHRDTSTDT
jgi:hypothetical protein